ncbi:hypothetical protein IRJ41_020066, partial [Triplophysa rosa]
EGKDDTQLYSHEIELITLSNRLQTLFRLRERDVGEIASANHRWRFAFQALRGSKRRGDLKVSSQQ